MPFDSIKGRDVSDAAATLLADWRARATAEGFDVRDDIIRSPGRFEGEHVGILAFYAASMDGFGDIVWSDDNEPHGAESFTLEPGEADALDADPSHTVAVLSWSSCGFYSLETGSQAECDALAERMAPEDDETEDDETDDETDAD